MANLDRWNDSMNDEMDRPEACLMCEAMLPDAVDGLLSEAEQMVFDRHVAGCTACAEELAEAQRGAAWLGMLKGHTPEPSPALLGKILAQTTGAQAVMQNPPVRDEAAYGWGTQSGNVVAMPAFVPAAIENRPMAARTEGKLLQFRRKVVDIFSIENARSTFQPRFAMTAAMAFFSVALTMNMTGVKLSEFHASSFRPSNLRRTVADTQASMVRSFQNMSVVYQVESKLEDIRNDGRDNGRFRPATQDTTPAQPAPENKNGNSNEQQDGPKAVPHGSSALEFPVTRESVPVRKGA